MRADNDANNEKKETGGARLQCVIGLGLHLPIVNTDVHERTANGSRGCADGSACASLP